MRGRGAKWKWSAPSLWVLVSLLVSIYVFVFAQNGLTMTAEQATELLRLQTEMAKDISDTNIEVWLIRFGVCFIIGWCIGNLFRRD